MSWVKEALYQLNNNGIAKIRPHGGSMRGRIESGQLVTLKKVSINEIDINDVIFVKWKGNYLLHVLKDKHDNEVLIGNNLGKINGWISKDDIIAKVVDVED